jgi:ribosome recycling factor
MFNSYKSKLSKEDYSANKEEIIQKITDNFVDHLARDMRNKNIEKIVNE